MKKKSNKRKAVSIAIALALVCGSWMPVLAGGEDTTEPQVVNADGETVNAEYGSITISGNPSALEIQASNGGSAVVTTGSLTGGEDGVGYELESGTNAELTVNGDITADYPVYRYSTDGAGGTMQATVSGDVVSTYSEALYIHEGSNTFEIGGRIISPDDDGIDLYTDSDDENTFSVGNGIESGDSAIYVRSDDSSKTEISVTGDVSGENFGINVSAEDESKIDVSVTGENANVTGGDAIAASAYGKSEVNITVEGDVEGTGRREAEKEDEMPEEEMPEDDMPEEEDMGLEDGAGITAIAGGEGTVNVSVGGDVTGNYMGIYAEAHGSEGGFVARRTDEPLMAMALRATVPDAETDDDEEQEEDSETIPASVDVDVAGDVTAGELGVNTSVSGGSTVNIHIGGNLTSSSTAILIYADGEEIWEPVEERPMLRAALIPDAEVGEDGESANEEDVSEKTQTNSSVNIVIGGDVAAENYGVVADLQEEGSTADVVIGGTLSANDCPILIAKKDADEESRVTLTVWKIVPNEEGVLAQSAFPGEDDEETLVEDEEFEKSIQYIIKLEQPTRGAVLSATNSSGNALNTSHDYEVANESDTILLKVDLEKGYKVTGAYNGLGEKVALVLDADGNYFVVVPRGGGVYLSVTLDLETYKVVFEDEDGNPLEEKEVPYGETPTYTGPEPTKKEDEGYTYTFDGWDVELSPVTGNVTYKATFVAHAKTFAITFDLGGGTLDGQTGTIVIKADFGSTITLPGAPTKEGSKFLFWKGSQYDAGAKYIVKGDHTFVAEWEAIKEEAPATEETPTATPTTAAANGAPKTGDVGSSNEWIGRSVVILGLAMVAFVVIKTMRKEEEEC